MHFSSGAVRSNSNGGDKVGQSILIFPNCDKIIWGNNDILKKPLAECHRGQRFGRKKMSKKISGKSTRLSDMPASPDSRSVRNNHWCEHHQSKGQAEGKCCSPRHLSNVTVTHEGRRQQKEEDICTGRQRRAECRMRGERRTNGKKAQGREHRRKKNRKERHPDRTRGSVVGPLEHSGAVPAANRTNCDRQMKTNAANLVAGGATPSH